MNIPQGIFKSYDIRGIYPEEINEENIYQITQAVLAVIQKKVGKDNVILSIGRDMRLSAPKLYPIFKKALIDGGAQLIDNNLVATPTFYFSVLFLKADAGIQLTASHNPPQYTGMKMVFRTDNYLTKIGKETGMPEVKENALAGTVLKVPGGNERKNKGVVTQEIDQVFSIIPKENIKPLKIVVDPANAMGSIYIEELFKNFPCKLVKMNFELDGSFPAHNPDPLVERNLLELKKRVLDEKADLGIAPDGDGDRVIFINEKGEVIPAAVLTALVAREVLRQHPGKMIGFNIPQTMTPKKIIEESGGRYFISPVGHAYMTKYMQDQGALFGGEVSGHYYFKETGGAESGAFIIAYILDLISQTGKSISQLIQEVRRSYESGEYNFTTENAKDIMDKLKKIYADGKLTEIDGIAIDYLDWRLSVRSSNTESLLRLNVEAIREQEMKKHLDELITFIESNGATRHYD